MTAACRGNLSVCHRFASPGLGLVVQAPYLAALHVTSGSIFVAAVCESVYQIKKNWPCTEILYAAAISVGK